MVRSQSVRLNDFDFMLHTWEPAASTTVKGLVIIFHGFLAHGLYPTVRYAAELLNTQNFAVAAPDFRGHGQSPGLRGYLPSRELLLEDGAAIVRHCQAELFPGVKKCFLVGSSMGGTIALSVAQTIMNEKQRGDPSSDIAGVALLAPMLQLSVGAPARSLLHALSYVAPTWQIIPSSSTDAALQYRDQAKRQECEEDPQSVQSNGKIRIGSASTCVELSCCVDFSSVAVPFLVMVADEDVVVQNQGSLDLYEQSPATTDKTLRRYPALHGLLCEPSPLVDTIQKDLLEWMEARS